MQIPKSDFSFIETNLMQGVAFAALLESVRVGLFDTLDQGPLHAEAIAEHHGFAVKPTEALLNLLTGMRLLQLGPDGYANTLASTEFFVSSSPFYQGKSIELHNHFNTLVQEHLGGLLQGKTDMREAMDEGWSFEDSMTGTMQHARLGALQETTAFIASLPGLDESGLMADIGGNHGEFSMALLEKYPAMTGEILDLPNVARAVTGRIQDRGFAKRLSAVGVDLREERLDTDRYDLILASHVLYGFVDELEAFALMLYAAMKPGGWFVSHHLNPAGNLDPEYTNVVQFVTDITSYKTHFIEKSRLENALQAAGFSDIRTCPVGVRQGGLLLAGRRS